MNPRIEIWNSNQNQEERHYFMPGSANEYIAGFNPKLISEETAKRIVNMILSEQNAGAQKS